MDVNSGLRELQLTDSRVELVDRPTEVIFIFSQT